MPDPELETPTCTYCAHSIDDHGTTQVGCAWCDCGFEGDWHGDDA